MLLAVATTLDTHGITPTALRLETPTLDDAFLALTTSPSPPPHH